MNINRSLESYQCPRDPLLSCVFNGGEMKKQENSSTFNRGLVTGVPNRLRGSWECIMTTEHIRKKFQRVSADIMMIESLLDLIDRGRNDPEIWRAADKLLLDLVSIMNSLAEEFESHYDDI
jgi:hypothetical protein